MTGFEERIFKEVIKLHEVIRVGRDILRRGEISTEVHTGKSYLQAKERGSEETNPANTLVSDLEPPEL